MEWKKRPTVMLTGDEWYGHRDPFTGKPVGDKTDWVSWDFSLARAYQTIEYYRDQNGIFQWQKDDPLEDIQAKKKIDPFQASVDSITKHQKEPVSGQYFVPDVRSRRKGGEMWTYADWLEDRRAKIVESQTP